MCLRHHAWRVACRESRNAPGTLVKVTIRTQFLRLGGNAKVCFSLSRFATTSTNDEDIEHKEFI